MSKTINPINKIENFVRRSNRLLILAIGSELRSDDAVGMYIASRLEKENFDKERIMFAKGGTAPENLTGEIKKYKPTHMIIIDAADTGKKPGEIDIISIDSVSGASFSTHMMPISVFIDYLLRDFECKFLIVGIQPEYLEFGTEISETVKKSAEEIILLLKELIKNEK